jgi:hypothetical protein
MMPEGKLYLNVNVENRGKRAASGDRAAKRRQHMHARVNALVRIFTSPAYIAIAVVSFIAYYFLFKFFASLESRFFVFITVPSFLIYLLAASAAILLTISVFASVAAYHKFKAGAATCAVTSGITSAFGGLVAGCGCNASFIVALLSTLGVGFLPASAFVAFLTRYNVEILLVLTLINLLLAYYQLGVVAKG